MNRLVEWSLVVEAGLHRPPLIRANGKAPLDAGWTTGPFDDPELWRKRLDNHHGNVGMVCGQGLLAVDADTYKPGCALDALLDDTGLTRDTVTALTGGGGQHLLYTCDPGLSVPSIPLGPLGYPGVELKSYGGQIIVEPSVHPATGRQYSWELSSGPGDIEAVPATDRFLELVGAIPRGRGRRHQRWKPLDDADDQLDQLNVEAARLLCEHFDGHHPVRTSGGEIGVYRPGKTTGSVGATIGYIGPGVVKVWTDGWPPFVQGNRYDLGQLKQIAGLVPEIVVPDIPCELPSGYRIWREGDGLVPVPVLDDAARLGLIGDYLQLIAGRTEAPAATVGAYLVACFGTILGRSVAYAAPPHVHYPKVYVAIVGPTSSGAKDVSRTVAMVLVKAVDPLFVARHSLAGLGSGERLVHEVRDIDPDEKGDQHPTEKRRIVLDAELSAVLRIVHREGSILGDHLRQAFDNDPLRHSTITNKTTVASDHHISLIGGITPKELGGLVDETSVFNGFLNRFTFVWSELSELHPFGGEVPLEQVKELAGRFGRTRDSLARHISINDIHQVLTVNDGAARELWRSFYVERRQGLGDSDLMRAITGRQITQAARIALVYAALAGASSIGVDHLRAAFAWCDYSVGSIKRIFTAGPAGRAGQLLAAIRERGAEGLAGVEQYEVFHRHVTADGIAALRAQLESEHLIVTQALPTAGRDRLMSFAIWKTF